MTILSIISLVVAFFLGASIYRLGLKDGLATGQSKPLEAILPNPISYIEKRKVVKENNKISKEFAEGLNNIMTFTGDPQPKGE